MESEPRRERSAGLRWPAVLLVLFLLTVLSALGVWLYRRYDPFFSLRPAVHEAKALLDVASKRPLTDEEFEAAVGLLASDTSFARLSALSILELEAGRTPERKARIVTVLTERQTKTSDVTFRQLLSRALGRLLPDKKGGL